MSELHWIDGRWVGAAELSSLSPLDPGVQRGVGVFETMGASGQGEIALWERHLARILESSRAIGLEWRIPSGLRTLARELLERTGRPDGILRLTVLAGVGKEARTLLTSRDRVKRSEQSMLRLHPVAMHRGYGDPTATLKTTSRLFYELAEQEAHAALADDALILGPASTVLETARGNVFAKLDGRLVTPVRNGAFLAGIGRAVLLEILADDQVTPRERQVQERVVTLAELQRAEAIWVVNAVYGPQRAVLGPIADDGPVPVAVPDPADPLLAAWRASVR